MALWREKVTNIICAVSERVVYEAPEGCLLRVLELELRTFSEQSGASVILPKVTRVRSTAECRLTARGGQDPDQPWPIKCKRFWTCDGLMDFWIRDHQMQKILIVCRSNAKDFDQGRRNAKSFCMVRLASAKAAGMFLFLNAPSLALTACIDSVCGPPSCR